MWDQKLEIFRRKNRVLVFLIREWLTILAGAEWFHRSIRNSWNSLAISGTWLGERKDGVYELDTVRWPGEIRGPRPHDNNCKDRWECWRRGWRRKSTVSTQLSNARETCSPPLCRPVHGLTNRKHLKSNWRDSISLRQWPAATDYRVYTFQKLHRNRPYEFVTGQGFGEILRRIALTALLAFRARATNR